jgi:2-keto-4-pentenoate hydratase/2-oxohepta-3-ene-1,7-dioic acid hydratase in catechol pathway
MKIICIGMNYQEHARELGNEVPDTPVFFMKADSALLRKNQPFFYPDFSSDIHYEAELVIKINKVGRNIKPEFVHRYFDEITLGADITARDLQKECRQNGMPWEICKSFDQSAPMGKFVDKNLYNLRQLNFCLTVNGETVQKGNTEDMIFSLEEIVAYVSRFITLKTGDVIFTGTPPGVGPLQINDHVEGYIENEKILEFVVK